MSAQEVASVLAKHTIECTGPGEVTCAGCRALGWMGWSAYRKHLAAALEPLIREREAKAWDDGYRASGGDHWWTFEPGDECEQPHRPNPYRGQA